MESNWPSTPWRVTEVRANEIVIAGGDVPDMMQRLRAYHASALLRIGVLSHFLLVIEGNPASVPVDDLTVTPKDNALILTTGQVGMNGTLARNPVQEFTPHTGPLLSLPAWFYKNVEPGRDWLKRAFPESV
jgi:hypothetical protein